MDIIDAILKANKTKDIYKIMDNNFKRPRLRYGDESLLVCFLSEHALNKEKNRIKPAFEGLELLDIFTHLVSEVFEIKFELNQDKIDFNRVLDEIADCAGLLSGLIAWIIEHKDDIIEE